jgi:hypothetical protein
MSYPTQEDELRAKEAEAEDLKVAEETSFLAAFRSVPKNNADRLEEMSKSIVDTFNGIMNEARTEPFERQEDVMAGMKRLFQEQINVIEARRKYTIKINPNTALKDETAA